MLGGNVVLRVATEVLSLAYLCLADGRAVPRLRKGNP